MLHQRRPLRFQCTQCGRCCTGGGDYYVFVDAVEAERIRAHLGLSRGWFRRRYLTRAAGERVLASRTDGRCVFLQDHGRCRVYGARPVQCQTYPFWPELLRGATAWEKEGKRCEGIGRGPVVPVARIEAALARCKDPEAG